MSEQVVAKDTTNSAPPITIVLQQDNKFPAWGTALIYVGLVIAVVLAIALPVYFVIIKPATDVFHAIENIFKRIIDLLPLGQPAVIIRQPTVVARQPE
jgi:hypothetical protein